MQVERVAHLLFTYLPPNLTAESAQLRVSRERRACLATHFPLQQQKYAKEHTADSLRKGINFALRFERFSASLFTEIGKVPADVFVLPIERVQDDFC
jgi:hypothetical protein